MHWVAPVRAQGLSISAALSSTAVPGWFCSQSAARSIQTPLHSLLLQIWSVEGDFLWLSPKQELSCKHLPCLNFPLSDSIDCCWERVPEGRPDAELSRCGVCCFLTWGLMDTWTKVRTCSMSEAKELQSPWNIVSRDVLWRYSCWGRPWVQQLPRSKSHLCFPSNVLPCTPREVAGDGSCTRYPVTMFAQHGPAELNEGSPGNDSAPNLRPGAVEGLPVPSVAIEASSFTLPPVV